MDNPIIKVGTKKDKFKLSTTQMSPSEYYKTYEEYQKDWADWYTIIKSKATTAPPYNSDEAFSVHTLSNYPLLLAYFANSDLSKIFTKEFDRSLDDIIFNITSPSATFEYHNWLEFINALFLKYDYEFINVLQGKTYQILKNIYNINLKEIDISGKYKWKWLIYSYRAFVQDERLNIAKYEEYLKIVISKDLGVSPSPNLILTV